MKNKGIILGNRQGDWGFAGAESQIVYEVVNPSGDWTPYLPPGEWQWNPIGFDTQACVTFSALNIIETLIFFHTGVRKNYSDRFTAVMSGTTPTGNYMWKVGDSIRKDGLVAEERWPAIENPTWDTYYSAPPIDVINEAKLYVTGEELGQVENYFPIRLDWRANPALDYWEQLSSKDNLGFIQKWATAGIPKGFTKERTGEAGTV